MAKFRKKPVVIEAVQFTGTNASEIGAFAGAGLTYKEHFDTGEQTDLSIHTLEGDMTAGVGDWIIKGIKGEFYPCKPDIFEATYEAVDE